MIFIIAFAVVVLPSHSIAEVDWWSTFHHDPLHTGYSTSAVPSTNRTIWNFTTGSVLESCPAIVGDELFFGSGDGNFYALNASTDTQIWNYATGGVLFPPQHSSMIWSSSVQEMRTSML
ncbi:MAG: PQQ-binding-like beta-propeller repeat protein [Candidatus Bathyarchaeia archaeon]